MENDEIVSKNPNEYIPAAFSMISKKQNKLLMLFRSISVVFISLTMIQRWYRDSAASLFSVKRFNVDDSTAKWQMIDFLHCMQAIYVVLLLTSVRDNVEPYNNDKISTQSVCY